MFVNTCMVAKYVIINWEMFSMKKVNNDTVFGILQLETLLGDINSIFSEIESEYKMSREEILILLTLWQKGSMTLKEMDRFVEVKPYKRTRTYNNLVELGFTKSVLLTMKEQLLFILMKSYNKRK